MKDTTKRRRNFSCEFKLQIMRELERGKSNAHVAREHELREGQVSKWYAAYRKGGEDAFKRKKKKNNDVVKIADLEQMVGRLHVENDILKRVSGSLEDKLSQLRKR